MFHFNRCDQSILKIFICFALKVRITNPNFHAKNLFQVTSLGITNFLNYFHNIRSNGGKIVTPSAGERSLDFFILNVEKFSIFSYFYFIYSIKWDTLYVCGLVHEVTESWIDPPLHGFRKIFKKITMNKK